MKFKHNSFTTKQIEMDNSILNSFSENILQTFLELSEKMGNGMFFNITKIQN